MQVIEHIKKIVHQANQVGVSFHGYRIGSALPEAPVIPPSPGPQVLKNDHCSRASRLSQGLWNIEVCTLDWILGSYSSGQGNCEIQKWKKKARLSWTFRSGKDTWEDRQESQTGLITQQEIASEAWPWQCYTARLTMSQCPVS